MDDLKVFTRLIFSLSVIFANIKKKEAKQKDQPNKPDCGGSQSSGYNKMFQKLLYGAII